MVEAPRGRKKALTLYHIQDDDRPMHVIVRGGIDDAIEVWRAEIGAENPDCDMSGDMPNGVVCVARNDGALPDIVIDRTP